MKTAKKIIKKLLSKFFGIESFKIKVSIDREKSNKKFFSIKKEVEYHKYQDY